MKLIIAVVQDKDDKCLSLCSVKLEAAGNLLQFGADATTGLGWCSVSLK